MSNVFQKALDCYRGNRDVAIFNRDLRTTGKLVGGQRLRMTTQDDIDQLTREISMYDQLISTLERKLAVSTQEYQSVA
jgi:hypothetical protein